MKNKTKLFKMFRKFVKRGILLDAKYCTEKKFVYKFTNDLGYKIMVEICQTECDPKDKKTLPYIWFKKGYTKKIINNYLTCNTYVKDLEGQEWDVYNPTHKKGKIDFKWILEATPENEIKLVNKVYDLANKDHLKYSNIIYDDFNRFDDCLGIKEYSTLYKKAEKTFKSLFINAYKKFENEACFISTGSLHGFYFPNLKNGLKCIAFKNGKATAIYNI